MSREGIFFIFRNAYYMRTSRVIILALEDFLVNLPETPRARYVVRVINKPAD
jgi:hypothetical protein